MLSAEWVRPMKRAVSGCSALIANQFPSDDETLDLGSSFVDPGRPNLAVEALDDGAALDAGAAVDLDGAIDDALGGFGGEELGGGGFARDARLTGVLQPRGAIDQ